MMQYYKLLFLQRVQYIVSFNNQYQNIKHNFIQITQIAILIQLNLQLGYKMKERKRKVDELAQISDPEKVRVLILTEQRTSTKDFFFIKNFVNVKKMDLSYNRLTNFPVGFSFASFNCLSVLFLHYNKFPNIKSLVPLIENQNLQYLTLFGNPLQQGKTRHYFVNEIPTLKLMDDRIVKVQQRCPQPYQYNTDSTNIGFPLFNQDEAENSTAYLAILVKQLKIVRDKYLQCNPILKIQRKWKSKLGKPQNNEKQQNNIKYLEQIKKIQQPPKQKQSQILPSTKAFQEKIVALFMMNSQFWQKIKQMSSRKIYCLRQYCQINNVPFKEINGILALRIPTPNHTSTKKFLNFFIQCNSFILAVKTHKQDTTNNNAINLNNYLNNKQVAKFQLVEKKISQLYNKYQGRLVEIDLSSQEKSSLIKKKYKICIDKKTIFPFFFEELLERNLASVRIQKMWRGSRSRKVYKAKIMIQRNKAAIKIQKWFRKLPFIHRQKFLLYSNEYIVKSSSTYIILPFKLLYDTINSSNHKIRLYFHMLIPFQTCNFAIEEKSIKFYSERLPYPHYLRKLLSLQLVDSKTFIASSAPNIYDILFKHSQQIEYFNLEGNKYVRFTYYSIQQTRNRRFLLALLTYSMRNHIFLESFDHLQPKQARLKSVNQQIKNQVVIASEYKTHDEIISWKKLKIKYFNGKDNHATTLKTGWLRQNTILQTETLKQKLLKIGKTQPQPIHRSYMILQKQVSEKLSERYLMQPSSDQSNSIYTENRKLHESISNSSINYLYSQTQIMEKQMLTNLQNKKSRIKDIKQTHRQRSLKIWAEKQEHLKKIRQETLQSQKQTLQVIKSLKISEKLRNIEKCRNIKQRSSKADDKFQKQFITKGNRSMKIQMLKFEKKDLGNSSSRRYQKSPKDKQSIKSMYTEIKQFSHNMSNDMFSEYKKDTSNDELFSLLNPPDKMNIKTKINEIPKNISQISKEIIEQQVRRKQKYQPQIKSQHLAQHRQPLKKMKKLIHSVFPEQFYPLQESGQFGFELPKINRKQNR